MGIFLVGTIPAVGHFNPGVPIVAKLVSRGHDVYWYTSKAFENKVKEVGANFLPMKQADDYGVMPIHDYLPALRDKSGLSYLKYGIKHLFLDAGIDQMYDLDMYSSEISPNVILTDTVFVGGGALYETQGIPWAVYGVTPLAIPSADTAPFGLGIPPGDSKLHELRNKILNLIFDKILFHDVNSYYQKIRKKIGLPYKGKSLLEDAISPLLFLQGTIPEFEYPRSDLPSQIHFTGPFLPESSDNYSYPRWWTKMVNSDRVYLITQGTVSTNPAELIFPAIESLSNFDGFVIVTSGYENYELIASQIENDKIVIEPFIPYDLLMPNVDVMITNGGYGSVQYALSHGVPLIVAGDTEEKAEIGARVKWSGTGRFLRTKSPKSEEISHAISEILIDRTYEVKANEFAKIYNDYDGPEKACRLLERLAETEKPVLARE